jgi:hypothetical protein
MSYAAPSRRARSLTFALTAILVLLLATAHGAGAAVKAERINFEGAGLQQFDQVNASTGSLGMVAGGYGDAHAAQAHYNGGGQNGYARGIFNVDWHAGDDVWYSAAYYLPTGFKAAMQGQVALMRWDDYGSHPDAADHSGIVINGGDKHAHLAVDHLGTSTQYTLGAAFDLPEGRWFHLEVHQHLGSTNAANDVYLDGTRVATSNQANLEPGRGVDRIRYGLVAIADGAQTHPLTLNFDDATVNTTQTGPDPALAQPGNAGDPAGTADKPVVAPPAPTPAPASTPAVAPPPPAATPPATATPRPHPAPAKPAPQVRRCVRAALKRARRRGAKLHVAAAVSRCTAQRAAAARAHRSR